MRERSAPCKAAPRPTNHFDVICGFQVLDHVPDAAALLAACFKDLKPGGLALFINHDCGGLTNRLLGALSPIVLCTALADLEARVRMAHDGKTPHVAESGVPITFRRFGAGDQFSHTCGDQEFHRHAQGLSAPQITDAITALYHG